MLAAEAALNRPAFDTLDAPTARRMVSEQPSPPGQPVAAVKTLAIPRDDGEAMPARVYAPFGDGPWPVVVYVHGGGFVLCDLDTHDGICRNIAADAGAVVVSIDYRLAPEHPFPAAADDAVTALRWVAGHLADIGGAPGRLVVAGDSAGGHLAAVAALRLREAGETILTGQVLVYPVTDHYGAGHPSYAEFADGYGLTDRDMVWFWDQFVPPARAAEPWVSPLRAADLAGLPAACVVTAECDVLRDEGEAYAARLAAAGVPVRSQRFAGLNHGCLGLAGTVPCVAPMHAFIVAWLNAHFGR